MRFLPALVEDRLRWVLPMADRSASMLAELLLASDERGVPAEDGSVRRGAKTGFPSLNADRKAAAEQLAMDPPLVLWAVCLAARRDQRRLRTITEVAEWLARCATEVLRWDAQEESGSDAADGAGAEAWGDEVAAGVTLAHLAAEVAQNDAQEAYLAGLLHAGAGWFFLARGGQKRPAARTPWDWLATSDGGATRPHVEKALAILSGEVDAEPAGPDVQASRDCGAMGRRLWLETVHGAAALLPILSARLSRLGQLEHEFQESLETEKLAAMAEFAAGAGHEINNPLAIIAGRAQLLLRDEADPERRRELASINAQVKRAHEMIADLWLFARPPRPEPQRVDLVQLVDRVVEEIGPQAAQRGVSVRRTGEPGPLTAEADPVQLCVALHALCRNSLEAIGRDGQVEIELRGGEAEVEIRVSDTGPGIAPEQRRHIFDPFYSARQAGRGLGMGLSKCWRIVTNHGGRISVEGEAGRGAQFVITLPRVAPRCSRDP